MICPAISVADGSTIASALDAVDCLSGQATAQAFARLFGSHGGLTVALTIGLTIYVALIAIGLVTGRVTLGLASLSPRVMTLGLALTFATSWMAYQNVVWGLLSGGPDQVAGMVLGIRGSASHAFAQHLDTLFNAVSDAAERAHAAQGDAKGTTPGDMLSYAAMLLLLGTVGVLVTSRIALAALLAVGPVFLILALFSGTRGLFEGWVKGAVLFALVPLFTVLIGAGALALADPVVADLGAGEVDMRSATAVFLVAAVHCALMAMVLKVATTLVAGWRIDALIAPWLGGAGDPVRAPGSYPTMAPAVVPGQAGQPAGGTTGSAPPRDPRIHAIVTAMAPPAMPAPAAMPGVSVAGPSLARAMQPSAATTSAPSVSRAQSLGRSLGAPENT
ncbi:type IV secretion system protein [Novosphingobium sp. SG720]|uniref:type IV secretion system protein n=1 Tax=Novosphingobium sp. SG720 TaxID=2586998 RepID=UPI0014472D64|nr:type IV secretion system protein [Novosphingobium sp. SG720]NKJ43941.1 type IV secretion system protein VirB6 [Novosphingobium sp. SG720]